MGTLRYLCSRYQALAVYSDNDKNSHKMNRTAHFWISVAMQHVRNVILLLVLDVLIFNFLFAGFDDQKFRT